MENIGKIQYDNIPIPDELEQVVSRAVRKGMWHRTVKHLATSAAAVLAVMILCANVPVLYAGAAEIPLLGQMVRIMRIGSGGQEVTGITASAQTIGDTVQLHFETAAGGSTVIPRYSATRKSAPFRVVLRLHGIEELDVDGLVSSLRKHDAVADAYPNAYSTRGDVGVTFLLKEGFDCAVGEYDAPDTLGITFYEEPAEESTAAYYLRSAAMPFGNELAGLTEQLAWEGATQIRLEDGCYCVVLGGYQTEKQALQAQSGLNEKLGEDLGLYVVQCGKYDLPTDQKQE